MRFLNISVPRRQQGMSDEDVCLRGPRVLRLRQQRIRRHLRDEGQYRKVLWRGRRHHPRESCTGLCCRKKASLFLYYTFFITFLSKLTFCVTYIFSNYTEDATK